MVCFAANSLLCRLAFKRTAVDPATFTSVRIIAGAVTPVRNSEDTRPGLRHAGSWPSALALFIYAAAFSYAYVSLTAGTGALLLFAAVQTTMIG